MTGFISHYLRLMVFTIALLVGVQMPALIDQYEKRVEAHLLEAQSSLEGFQQTANQYFEGDLVALIHYYAQSKDAVFRKDADNLRFLVNRKADLTEEYDHLQQSAPEVLLHLLVHVDTPLMAETLRAYTYVVILSPEALLWGLVIALLLAIVIDSLWWGGCRCLAWAGQRIHRH